MTDVPVIDRARLDLVCMGNPGLAGEFIDLLIEESTPILAGLPALVAAGDVPAVREGAHSVKGIAGNVGAARLQAAALQLERSAADGAAASVLAGQLDAVVAALAELRAERSALS
jgi:HPt (histidine-containing phosphotransfer) domain-containing protein